jgi:hypothetical protein
MEITAGNGKKMRLLSRENLDGRTTPARVFSQLATAIENDLGGRSELSAIELQLIEAFCGASVMLGNLNAKLILGEPVEPMEHAHIASTMTRISSRLGLKRRQRDVSPSLSDLIDEEPEAHD